MSHVWECFEKTLLTTHGAYAYPHAAKMTSASDIAIYASDPIPLLPEGEYEAVGTTVRKLKIFGSDRVEIVFTVIIPDATAPNGVRHERVSRYYRVTSTRGRTSASRSGRYQRDWSFVTGRRPTRHDRLPPNVFIGKMFRVRIRTVTHDSRQRELAPAARYSAVDEIIEVLTR